MSSKTVYKAIDILDSFTCETPTWGLRELARKLEMSHTIVHRILSTFEERGYVFRNPNTQKYELGIKLLELSKVVEENLKLPELIHPIMKKLALETEESIVLTMLDNNEGLFVKIIESKQQVRFAESVGKRSPLYVGASHKVILAYMSPEIQNRIIDLGIERDAPQLKSKEKIIETLESIRKQGWFYTTAETFQDVSAVAVPLFDSNGKIFGSISVAGPSYRLDHKKVLPILQKYQLDIDSILNKISIPTRRNPNMIKLI